MFDFFSYKTIYDGMDSQSIPTNRDLVNFNHIFSSCATVLQIKKMVQYLHYLTVEYVLIRNLNIILLLNMEKTIVFTASVRHTTSSH